MTAVRISFAVVAVVAIAGCAKPPPRQVVAGGRATVNEMLVHADTEGALARFTGSPPDRCVESAAGARLCQWRLGNRNKSWARLAKAIGTRDQVNLLCELPAEGPREPDSCAAFPRRSNRTLYTLPNPSGAKSRRNTSYASREAKAAVRDRYRRDALERIDGARTLVELSHLVGAAPDGCSPLDSGRRLCFWRASAQTYGHGLLVESIGASKRERVVLRCALPRDGSPRGPETCRVEKEA